MTTTTDEIIVYQKEGKSRAFETTVDEAEITLDFVRSTTGRLDFSIGIEGELKGTYNLLSQDSIVRMFKNQSSFKDKERLKEVFLKIGTILRDGGAIRKTSPPAGSLTTKAGDMTYPSLKHVSAKAARKFLRSGLLLDEIDHILRNSRPEGPFIGERDNLILVYLSMLSCMGASPLNLEMVGQSSAGKTHLVLTARNGLPEEMVMVLAGASKESLKYDYDSVDADGNYIVSVANKCIVVLEKDESQSFIKRMKPLMSHDDKELVYKTPVKNDVTGELETKNFKIVGVPSFVTLTTTNPDDHEQVTRQLIASPDTSVDKVKDVVKSALLIKSDPTSYNASSEVDTLRAAAGTLKRYHIHNPWAELMVDWFPSNTPEQQRNVNKVISIIDTLTLIHQAHRLHYEHEGEKWLISSVEDNIIGLTLADRVLRASISGVPDSTWEVYQNLTIMDETNKSLTEDGILKFLHSQGLSMNRKALRDKHLQTLYDMGLIEMKKRGGGRGGNRNLWGLVKTRAEGINMFRLAPLMIESIAERAKEMITKHETNIRRSVVPKVRRRITKRDSEFLGLLKLDPDLVDRMQYLILPSYFINRKKRTLLQEILSDDEEMSKALFGKVIAWSSSSTTRDALREHTVREEAKKTKAEVLRTVVTPDEFSDDFASAYEEFLSGHIAPAETRRPKRRRRRSSDKQ